MPSFYIIKTGTTFPHIAQEFGDFDAWVQTALGPMTGEIRIIDAFQVTVLPAPSACSGVILTGSHAMVTDNLPWSLRLEGWIPRLLQEEVPLLGICYGHQLLARAAGGEAGFHPGGEEIGTVSIRCLAESREDPLFGLLPPSFRVHATHAQTVLRLPPQAVRLAANDHEPTHAFRLGSCAWGVQFHPEYTTAIMRAYIEAEAPSLAAMGRSLEKTLDEVLETPEAALLMRLFARITQQRP